MSPRWATAVLAVAATALSALSALSALWACPAGAAVPARAPVAARPSGAGRPAPGCSRPGAPEVVPARIVDVHAGALAVVRVCLDGRGPFPFAVDTGASQSLVAGPLARRLGLPRAGAPRTAHGIRCTEQVAPVEVRDWSLDGLALGAQQVLEGAMPRVPQVHLDGLIGADVLSRFGAVRIDYRAGSLTVPGPEGPALPGAAGPAAVPLRPRPGPTPAPVRAGVRLQAPLAVVAAHGAVAATVEATVGGTRVPLLVDTGTIVSAVSAAVARAGHLAPRGARLTLAAVGCPAVVDEVDSGPWRLAGTPLRPGPIAVLPPGGLALAGVLGSDVFRRYGAVAVDYRHGRLLLETG